MLRKKGCVPSALTQNVKDFLASPEIENIFENSDFLVLLSQAQGDRQILAKQLGISPHQLSYVTHTLSLIHIFMLCLVGGQGAGKSTFFRLLAVRDEWFSDDLRKLEDVYKRQGLRDGKQLPQ